MPAVTPPEENINDYDEENDEFGDNNGEEQNPENSDPEIEDGEPPSISNMINQRINETKAPNKII